MKIKVKLNSLVEALMNEMRAALQAMEAGNYDQAFEILEARSRPEECIEKLSWHDEALPFEAKRLAVEILKILPPGFITKANEPALEVVARGISSLAGKKVVNVEWLFSMLELSTCFGIQLSREPLRNTARRLQRDR